jgi:hypothetical protein
VVVIIRVHQSEVPSNRVHRMTKDGEAHRVRNQRFWGETVLDSCC